MKRYYNEATQEWYIEGQSLTRRIENGMFSGVPSVEQLLSWGFVEWTEPEPTSEELLEQARQNKLAELEAYDNSEEVNSFTVGGKQMWLDAQTRQQLRISLDAMQAVGRESVTKWFEGVEYTFPIQTWYQMLAAVEVYAADALNVTERHRAAIEGLSSITDINNYNYSQGYPVKLAFCKDISF